MNRKIRAVFHPDSLDRDLDAEIGEHVRLLAEEYVVRGTPPVEAERRARIALGGLTQLRAGSLHTGGSASDRAGINE